MLNDLKKGELIVFAAPSGAGKSSLIKEIISNNENIELSVSATTRSPREGETHGKDYFFITDNEFNDLKKKNAFIESADVVINRRMENAIKELKHAKYFDYIVLNDDFNRAFNDITSIIFDKNYEYNETYNKNILKDLLD